MIVEFTLMMLSLSIAVPTYWFMPITKSQLRMLVPIFISLIFLFILNPIILLSIIFYLIVIYVFQILTKTRSLKRRYLKQASWLVFFPLAAVPHIPPESIVLFVFGPEALSLPALRAFAFLGVSYTAIRAFIIIREALDGNRISVLETILAVVFFGSFSAGPIAGGGPYKAVALRLERMDAFIAISRIGFGVAIFSVLNPRFREVDLAVLSFNDERLLAWIEMYHRFLVLYIDFTGYTEIAIGTALLFGIRLPENFRWPLIATSIQEFWQRWHLSLGTFIGTYLFRPLVRETGKPAFCILVSFVLVGLWHSVSIQYMIWGVAHGVALSITLIIRRRGIVRAKSVLGQAVIVMLGWLLTITFVSFMSGFANQENYYKSMEYATKLMF